MSTPHTLHKKRPCQYDQILPFWGPYYCGKPGTPVQVAYPVPSLPASLSPEWGGNRKGHNPQGYFSEIISNHFPHLS